jgi:hypothetical protein
VGELADSRRRLEWQAQLLGRMSEVQSKHSREKSEAICELLDAEAGLGSSLDGAGAGGGDEEEEGGAESPTLSAQIAALQRKYLG